jgi:hypothetical protein
MPYGLSRRSRHALLAGVAGAAVTLSACGGGAAAHGVGAQKSTDSKVTGAQFCTGVASVMRKAASPRSWQSPSLAVARARLDTVLTAEADGFTMLERSAPAALLGTVRTIAETYRTDEHLVAVSTSMSQMNTSLLAANASGAGGAATQKLLAYIQTHCKLAGRR